ncbi:MAG: site-2 protease family protein [Oscillospiraceae bacterium]|jgi:Zn-dependent protease|nr:site-2 protease family protein [Oscillospiraceae bacterium]
MFLTLIRGGDFLAVFVGIAASLFVVFCTLPIHEFAHAYTANKMGDDTAKRQGRLTLNPIAHLDPFGSLMILLVGFGWAKPVPINDRNFKNRRRGIVLTSLAGPASNIVMAFIMIVLMNIIIFFTNMNSSMFAYALFLFFSFASNINIMLALFNLLPIPPLDGYRALSTVLPADIEYKVSRYENYIMIGVLVFAFSGFLSKPLVSVSGFIFTLLDSLASLPFRALS